jgi:hypothetical protein
MYHCAYYYEINDNILHFAIFISIATFFLVDPIPINENEKIFGLRVMEVVLFANNTFSTISGLGSSTVLRGKWDIVGTGRNYLWMQVWRFGFGRSVSGSTYRYVNGFTLTCSHFIKQNDFVPLTRYWHLFRCLSTTLLKK